MSTRSVIARKTPQGFEGRYLYSDSHPTTLGPTLFDLYHFFGDDITTLTRYLLEDHSAWRELVQKDYSLSPGYTTFSHTGPDCPKWDTEVRRDEATYRRDHDQFNKDLEAWQESYHRALEIYNQSEDGRRPQCYCHGHSNLKGDYYHSFVEAQESSCEYVYVIDEATSSMIVYRCTPPPERRWSILLAGIDFREPESVWKDN